jgi:hypothetical protein
MSVGWHKIAAGACASARRYSAVAAKPGGSRASFVAARRPEEVRRTSVANSIACPNVARIHLSCRIWQRLVKDYCVVKHSQRTARISRDDAGFTIAQRAIESLGVVSLPRIKHEKGTLEVAGGLFDGLHERSPYALPPPAGQHQELLNLGSVVRVRFGGQCQLDRASSVRKGGKKPTEAPLATASCSRWIRSGRSDGSSWGETRSMTGMGRLSIAVSCLLGHPRLLRAACQATRP